MAKRKRKQRPETIWHDPEALYARRTAAKLTEYRLAQAVGVSVGTVCAWERGERAIPEDILPHIAWMLQCRPADLKAKHPERIGLRR